MSNLKKKKSFNHGASRDQSPQMRSKERKSAGAGLLGNIFGSIFPKPSSQETEAEKMRKGFAFQRRRKFFVRKRFEFN